jgi:hypothetical protein
MTDTRYTFVPPAASDLPKAALDSATTGATKPSPNTPGPPSSPPPSQHSTPSPDSAPTTGEPANSAAGSATTRRSNSRLRSPPKPCA